MFPVKTPPIELILDYCVRKYGDKTTANHMLPEIAGRWYSQKDIYNYLGWDYTDEDDDTDTEDEDLPESIDELDDIDNIDDEILLDEMSDISGLTVDELDDLDAADFARLVDKALKNL